MNSAVTHCLVSSSFELKNGNVGTQLINTSLDRGRDVDGCLARVR